MSTIADAITWSGSGATPSLFAIYSQPRRPDDPTAVALPEFRLRTYLLDDETGVLGGGSVVEYDLHFESLPSNLGGCLVALLQWADYQDDGIVVLRILTSDAEGNPPNAADCRGWAARYGSSLPILADVEAGISRDIMASTYGYPFYMLVDRGMVIDSLGEGEGSIPESDILALLEE